MFAFFQTKLPPSATTAQKIVYPPLRHFLYFLFAYLPYAPVRRVNKPNLHGPYLWASSHSNFLCDTIPPSVEGASPAKYLAKSTLFQFPIKQWLEFCGALPVARAEDNQPGVKVNRSTQNRSTFRVAIAAMEAGWPVAIFPEGVSIVNPGLVLPLKPGIAKLGFLAEEANDFSLGLRIIPVGLEYGSRSRVGSGLTIRYGNPIPFSDYAELYGTSKDQAIKEVMARLTGEMLKIYPHFQDEKKLALGRKLVALGISRTKFAIAQLFLARENDADFWLGLDSRLRKFEEINKSHGIPLPAWGHRRVWKELGPKKRRKRAFWLVLGIPVAIYDFFNNSFSEFVLHAVVEQISVDETEKMSKRFMVSPFLLPVLFGFQFLFLKKVVFEKHLAEAGLGTFIAYCALSFVCWYLGVHWRRQCKRVASLVFFRWAGVNGRSEAVNHYRDLRQYLGELEHHGR